MDAYEAYFLIHRKFKSNIEVSEVAGQIGVGSSYLIKKYKEQFGESPRETINRLQIMWGEMQLVNTNKRVQDIAEELGMDASWFCVVFRKKFGISPLQYRKKHRKSRKTRK